MVDHSSSDILSGGMLGDVLPDMNHSFEIEEEGKQKTSQTYTLSAHFAQQSHTKKESSMPESAWNPFTAINWEDVVPKSARQHVEVWKARPAAPVNAICLSESIIGVYIHWLGKRSAPCLAVPPAECPFCKIEVPRRWEGYLGGYSERTGKKYLIHVSKEAARSCPMLSERKANLRGSRVIIERRGKAANAPCVARVESVKTQGYSLPDCFDVRAQLLLLWEGKGGLAALMANCRTIEEAAEMFRSETGYDS